MERVSRQLILSTQSGRLKPDVRLGVAVSELAQILDDDRKRDFQKLQTAGTQLSGRDAIRVTEELNRDSERRHYTWQPYGTKCGKFLDRLQVSTFFSLRKFQSAMVWNVPEYITLGPVAGD